MLSQQELMFAKIAILNEMVTKDQFFQALRKLHKYDEKHHLGVIMEREGLLTTEEVSRIMQSLSLIFSTQDGDLKKQREEEINFALAAQRDGYVSSKNMTRIMESLQMKAGNPEVKLEDMLKTQGLMSEDEIKRVKSGQPSADSIAALESLSSLTETDFGQEATPDEEDYEDEDDFEEDDEEPVELTMVRAPGREKTRKKKRKKKRIVQKWRRAIKNFQHVQRVIKAEAKRAKALQEEADSARANITEMDSVLKNIQDHLRKHKMTALGTDEYREMRKQAKSLEKKVVRVMRKTRDRGRYSGQAAEKTRKSMHRGFAELKN